MGNDHLGRMTIAGHAFGFDDVCAGSTTTVVDGTTVTHVCGRRWTDIMNCDESCLGQTGWAHTGTLRDYELEEIRRERAAREARIQSAIDDAMR